MDNEHHTLPFIDEHETKKTSFISYQSLLDDDDSGIVLTASQSSIDKTQESSSSSTSVKSAGNIPPPRPPPRRSRSPKMERKIEDRLVIGQKSSVSKIPQVKRELEDKKFSSETNVINRRRSLKLATQSEDDLLINLDPLVDSGGDNKPLFLDSVDSLASAFETTELNPSGDYVKLRETPVKQNNGNRRSISRTPAMKLPPDFTPKRPSIRRERSPISPDEEEKGISAFDPLWGGNSPAMQLTATEQKGSLSSVITTSPPTSNSDSLLKSWEIQHLTPGRNGQSSGFDYSKPATNISPVPGYGFINTSPFFSPQPYVQQNLNPHVNPVTAPSIHKSHPQTPPRPKDRPLTQSGLMFQSPQSSSLRNILQPQAMSSDNIVEKSDPFADLLTLNKERSSPQPQQSQWEKFD